MNIEKYLTAKINTNDAYMSLFFVGSSPVLDDYGIENNGFTYVQPLLE